MSNIKISALPEKTTLDNTDLIPIVDNQGTATTKKIQFVNAKVTLKGDPGATGPAGTSYPWRGQWLTATTYAVNDCVQQNGSSYICLFAHTSGTFATDLASVYWSLFVQKGDTGATGATGATGSSGANVNLLYGTSTTAPGGPQTDGTLYVTYIP